MQPRYKALLVHLLTATGAVLSMLAMLAAVNAEWSMMFLWLVAAFAVDPVGGGVGLVGGHVLGQPHHLGLTIHHVQRTELRAAKLDAATHEVAL